MILFEKINVSRFWLINQNLKKVEMYVQVYGYDIIYNQFKVVRLKTETKLYMALI
jgi:hypothetical protein